MTEEREARQARLDDGFSTPASAAGSKSKSKSGSGASASNRLESSEDRESGTDDTVLVKLSKGVGRESPTLAEYVTRGDRLVRFPTREAAEAELCDAPTVRLQPGNDNDPDGVDYYCCRKARDDPPAAERDPPEEGWTFRTGANAVGRMAEVAFTTEAFPKPVRDYAIRTLGMPEESLLGRKMSLDWVFGRGDDTSSDLGLDAPEHNWVPDSVVAVWDRERYYDVPERPTVSDDSFAEENESARSQQQDWLEARNEAHQTALLAVYLVEIKHGNTSFERSQKAALNEMYECEGPVVPLVARMDLGDVPQSYTVRLHPGPF